MAFTITLRFDNEEDMHLLTEALGAARAALENVKSMSGYYDEMASRLGTFQDLIVDAPRGPTA